jgi:cellulose synthase/poly-beta-1,6-N-acetylglucosamine synthase-like glycosyltransferase
MSLSLPHLYDAIHILFVCCLAIHCVLAGSVFWILFEYLRSRPGALAAEARMLAQPLPLDLPAVLVQLPTYNEGRLIARVAEAVAQLDWPAGRLHVQILDDSSDGSIAESEAAAETLRSGGISAEVMTRNHRAGFKAGALSEGLRRSCEPYIAIFDADYVPDSDFLRLCMRPLLNDPRIAFVQARCDYLNGDENAITGAQQRVLDAHFAVEQAARNWSGQLLPFNGTCGIWRRSAIDAAGGWQGDTLAEDLDLSYRAQLAGWRAAYLSGVAVRGELPRSLSVWRQQQFRWTKGFAEAGRKLLWQVWRSRLRFGQKLGSTFHLGSGLVGPLFALTLVSGVIDLCFGYGPTWPAMLLVGMSLLGGGIIGPAALMLTGQILVRGSTWKAELPRLPRILALQLANGLANVGGAFDALLGRATAFERTPKRADMPIENCYAPRTGS